MVGVVIKSTNSDPTYASNKVSKLPETTIGNDANSIKLTILKYTQVYYMVNSNQLMNCPFNRSAALNVSICSYLATISFNFAAIINFVHETHIDFP